MIAKSLSFIALALILNLCQQQVAANVPNLTETFPADCGLRNPDGVSFKIGPTSNQVQFGEFPWMVALLDTQKTQHDDLGGYMCGGALIAPNVVVTVAHCVDRLISKENLTVRAGEWDLNSSAEIFPHQDRQVRKIIEHEGFETDKKQNKKNDIALLVLESPFELTETVKVICLPPQNVTVNNSACIASAWGTFSSDRMSDNKESILRSSELSILPESQCEGALLAPTGSKLCVSGSDLVELCSGTSGSPLVCPISDSKTEYYLSGLISQSLTPCGDQNSRNIFVNVVFYRNWINAVIKQNGD